MDSNSTPAEGLPRSLAPEASRITALRDIYRSLDVTVDEDELLPVLIDKVREVLDAERATLYLLTDEGRELRSAITPGGEVPEIRLRVGEGIAGWVAQTGQTVNLPDVYADPRFQPEVDQRSGYRTRSMLCLPLPDHEGRTIGVLQLLNKRGRSFDGDDEALLRAVASHAGIALENATLHRTLVERSTALEAAKKELRGKARDLDILLEIESEATASTDLDDLLARLLNRAIRLIGAEAGAVLLREEPSGRLYFASTAGGLGRALLPLRPTQGRGIAAWVAEHRRPQIVEDPASDPRHDALILDRLGERPRNLLAVPLILVDSEADKVESLGAIELINRKGGASFDDEDLKLMTLVAGHASRAIQLARVREDRGKHDRLASIGQLLSGVLHDMRTPMTVISGYAQLMVGTEDETTRARLSQSIQRQFDILSAMTREVLQFARGESSILVRKVYVHKFVEELRQQLERELQGKPVTLEVDARYTDVAYFDELKMYRVIHNIARNAVQAMPDGGVFRLSLWAEDDDLRLDLADTGRGIPAELEGRLFQLFATARKSEGTGLGLAMVKKIIDEHGGKIGYTSTPRGTTFHITLPLRREQSRPNVIGA